MPGVFGQNDSQPDTHTLYAWLSREADGTEGVCAFPGPNGDPMALVFADHLRALYFTALAAVCAKQRNAEAHLVMFERGKTLRTITPGGEITDEQ